MGYLSLEDFLKLPSSLPSYIMAIRITDSLVKAKQDLREIKDQESRKKLSNYIRELEAFFNEQQ